MSNFVAGTRARVRIADAVQQHRARLSVVGQVPDHAPRVPFAALVLTVVGLGLVGLLVLNTSLQQGAFYARDLEDRAEVLSQRREALDLRLARLREPQRLAARASAIGMVPNDNPSFLRLPEGTVVGRAAAATAGSAMRFLAQRPGADASPPGSSGSEREVGPGVTQ